MNEENVEQHDTTSQTVKTELKYIKRSTGPNRQARRAMRKRMQQRFAEMYTAYLGRAGQLPRRDSKPGKRRRSKHGKRASRQKKELSSEQ